MFLLSFMSGSIRPYNKLQLGIMVPFFTLLSNTIDGVNDQVGMGKKKKVT